MIPLELITMLGSTVLGGVLQVFSNMQKAKEQKDMATLQALNAKARIVESAREYKNKGFQFTRRIIALSAVMAIIVWPKLVAVFWPEISTTVSWTEFNPGFLFLTEGRDVIEWKQLKGLVITPLDTHLVASIIGLYFGGSLTRR